MIPNTSSGPNMIVSKPLLVISSVSEFQMNVNSSIIVLCVVLSSISIIASPDISSIHGASTFINFYSLGFNTICCFGKLGRDLFKKLKFMTPSNSNLFLIPKTKSMFS